MALTTPQKSFMEIAIKFDVPGTTEEYYLTPLSLRDTEAMHEIVTTESINKFLANFPKSCSLEDIQTQISKELAIHTKLLSYPTREQRNEKFFNHIINQDHALAKTSNTINYQAIRHSSPDGLFVGAVILTAQQPSGGKNVVQLEYYLQNSHQGKHVVLSAAKAALKRAKEEFGVQNVYGSVSYDNVKAGNLMERIASETCAGGEKKVHRGDTIELRPGEKMGKNEYEKVERGSWTWQWTV